MPCPPEPEHVEVLEVQWTLGGHLAEHLWEGEVAALEEALLEEVKWGREDA